MTDPHRFYEIRCPVYGFIELNDWEREIISQPAFQRLRRIRQLGWTDYVYPGAMHTRFEHSLGVMHMATLLFDGITKRSKDILKNELGYNEDGLKRHKVLVRLTALLHDIGHAPFSHASEDLFPLMDDGKSRYKHEHYSAEIVRCFFNDVIKDHPLNTNYGLTAENVADLLEGNFKAGKTLFWRDLIIGQTDADRMDYLLRDSLHAGVNYGRYDWQRLINTVEVVPGIKDEGPRLGANEGGWHAAEGLILARYFMFTQVYFHKTRVAFDHHIRKSLSEMLPQKVFPSPQNKNIKKYLQWDDWKVLGLLSNRKGGEHGERLLTRNHYREIRHTPETPTDEDLKQLQSWKESLGTLLAAEESARTSWYKFESADIPIVSKEKIRKVKPLSNYDDPAKSREKNKDILSR